MISECSPTDHAAVDSFFGAHTNCFTSSKTTTIAQAHTVTITSTATLSAGQTAPTTDLTNYAAALPADVDTLSWNCPGASSYTTSNISPNANFDITCGIDWAQGKDAVGGGVVADIIGIVAYSAEDCMEACANFNMFQAKWSNQTTCAGVTFATQLGYDYGKYAANCWLKNGTAVSPTSNVNELGAVLVS